MFPHVSETGSDSQGAALRLLMPFYILLYVASPTQFGIILFRRSPKKGRSKIHVILYWWFFYGGNIYKSDFHFDRYYDLIKTDFEAEKCHFALAMMETDDKNFQLAENHYLQSLKV